MKRAEEVLRQLEVVEAPPLFAVGGRKIQDIEIVVVKDSKYMMNLRLAWYAGSVGVAGGCSDLPGVFEAKSNPVLRRKARSTSSSSLLCLLATFRTLPLGVHRSVV